MKYNLPNISLLNLYEISTIYVSTKSLRNIIYIYIYIYQIFYYKYASDFISQQSPTWRRSSQPKISFSIFTHHTNWGFAQPQCSNINTFYQHVSWILCTLYLLQTHHHLPLTSEWNGIAFCVLSLNDRLDSSPTAWHTNYLPKESSRAVSCLILLDNLTSIYLLSSINYCHVLSLNRWKRNEFLKPRHPIIHDLLSLGCILQF